LIEFLQQSFSIVVFIENISIKSHQINKMQHGLKDIFHGRMIDF